MRISFIILLGLMFIDCFAQNRKAENWGGKREFNRIIDQEIYYPEYDLEKMFGGMVQLEFEISSKGNIENIEVVKSISRGLDKEAIRLLNLTQWEPEIKNGEAVGSKQKIKIRFNPLKYNGLCEERGYQITQKDLDYIHKIYNLDELSKEAEIDYVNKDFAKYMADNLEYPVDALKVRAQGYVKLKFIVEPSGRVTNIKIYKSLEANCDLVAGELIENSNWFPAQKNGIPVRSEVKKEIFFSPGQGEIIRN